MKIKTWMLDSIKKDYITFVNLCGWSHKDISGFTKKFPQPTKHSSKITKYLAYCKKDDVKYWTIELCSDCYKLYKKKHSDVILTKLTVKDLFYLNITNENNS